MSRRPTKLAAVLTMSALCALSQGCSNGSSGELSGSGTGGNAGSTAGAKGGGDATNAGGTAGGPNSSKGSSQGGSSLGGGPGGPGGDGGAAVSTGTGSGGAGQNGSSNIGAHSGAGDAGGSGKSGQGGTAHDGGSGGQGGSTAQGGSIGQGGSSGAGGTGKGGSPGTTPSDGGSGASCPSTPLTPGNATHTIQVGGRSRTYVLHVPSVYTGSKAVPLLVDFHPHGSTGPSWQASSPYPKVTDGDGVIIAFPSAIGDWNVGPCCADDVDDLGFAKALVDEVKGLACIDAKRVYAAGFSMGGGMTNYVACKAAENFAAFAPAAFDLLQEIVTDCKPARAITVVSYRGTDDPYVPYEGGLSNLVKPINFLGAVTTMKKWAEFDGCTGSAADLGNGCQGYAASQCKDDVEVILCTKQGGGHDAANASLTWPVLKRHALP